MRCWNLHFKEKRDYTAKRAPFTRQQMCFSAIIHPVKCLIMSANKLLRATTCHTSVHFNRFSWLINMDADMWGETALPLSPVSSNRNIAAALKRGSFFMDEADEGRPRWLTMWNMLENSPGLMQHGWNPVALSMTLPPCHQVSDNRCHFQRNCSVQH